MTPYLHFPAGSERNGTEILVGTSPRTEIPETSAAGFHFESGSLKLAQAHEGNPVQSLTMAGPEASCARRVEPALIILATVRRYSAVLAMLTECCNGIKKCRKALTRRETTASVTRCNHEGALLPAVANFLPPLETAWRAA